MDVHLDVCSDVRQALALLEPLARQLRSLLPPLATVPVLRLLSQARVGVERWDEAIAAARDVVEILDAAGLGWHPLSSTASG